MAFLRAVQGQKLAQDPSGRTKMLCLVYCGLVLTALVRTAAQEIVAPEEKVKAAFLYNFAKFVEWPTNTFSSADAPLVIGVLGKDPFGKTLDDTVRGKRIDDRKIIVTRFRRAEDIVNCHVLFIAETDRKKLPPIFAALQNKPILTVGDAGGFRSLGGMIELIKSEDKIAFEINPDATSRAGLRLSSKLLRLDKNLRGAGGGSTNTALSGGQKIP